MNKKESRKERKKDRKRLDTGNPFFFFSSSTLLCEFMRFVFDVSDCILLYLLERNHVSFEVVLRRERAGERRRARAPIPKNFFFLNKKKKKSSSSSAVSPHHQSLLLYCLNVSPHQLIEFINRLNPLTMFGKE